jgi:molybdopterin/thiamine biosynthesis adenylyltransferase
MQLLKYKMSIHWQPFSSRVAFAFWQTLRHKIVSEWKLDASKKTIYGFVSQTSDSCVLEVCDDSFLATTPADKAVVCGELVLCNTAHEFKNRDKQALLAETTADFCVLIYPNIKNNMFLYWFGFPAEVLQVDALSVSDLYTWRVLDFKQSGFTEINTHALQFPFPVWSTDDGFVFPWFARRFLARLSKEAVSNSLLLRSTNNCTITIYFVPVLVPVPPVPRITIGWELDSRGLMCPRRADLRAAFDPRAVADQSARLNLELMRWRMLPGLDLDRLSGLKVLLIGAGTLGCHIARDLLAWGVRHITFADGGRVAYSNPVRQSLFEFSDSENEYWKALAAASALKRIHPSVAAEGHLLKIPMPGHPIHEAELAAVERDIDKLEKLINEHDVVFLLTDTRESRWLPSLMARAAGKPAFTVALGFDTWLVIRHGVGAVGAVGTVGGTNEGSGCYFCIDCVAPKNTTLNRTLDQQCTVTRPGVAPIASATAVELLVSLVHHPQQFAAPADHECGLTDVTASPLGIVPHLVRGFMSHMHTMTSAAECSKYCSACSDAVLSEYKMSGKAFIVQVCSDESVLEKVVGHDASSALDFDDSDF